METISIQNYFRRNDFDFVCVLLLMLIGLSREDKHVTEKPKEAKDGSSGLLIGGTIALGALLIILAIALWWFIRMRKKLREKGLFSKKADIIPASTPKITVNKIEFTVPTSNIKHQLWESDERDQSPLIPSPTVSEMSLSTDEERKSEGIPTSIGFLRPDLYASDTEHEDSGFPLGHIGRIWFRLEYDCEVESLFVTVINIANLPPRQHRGSSLAMSSSSTCDSFVRIYLLPDEKRYLQTKVKKRTRNPNFHQRFAFSMSYSVLLERTLRLSVFDVDRFTRQTIIGHALYSLQDLDITTATEEWRDLEKEALPQTDANGEVLLSLTYLPQVKRIALTVSKANGLHLVDFPSLCPYAKISHSVMGKVSKTKKTPVFRETENPQFDFCFEFKVDSDLLAQTCFTVEVMHSTSPVLKHDKLIGRADIGGSLVSRGKGLDHWTNAISQPNTPIKEWHFLKH